MKTRSRWNWSAPRNVVAGFATVALAGAVVIVCAPGGWQINGGGGGSEARAKLAGAALPVPPPQPKVQPPTATQPGPIAFIAADKRTPAQWMEYLGIRLVEQRDSSGPASVRPNDGDLYYFSNESTTWGATNTRNEIVAIDAKSYKVVARSELPEEYSLNRSSHGIGVSHDARWIYLPAIGSDRNFLLVIDGRTLKVNKVYESQGRPHHVNNFTAPDGRELMMVVDFGWNFAGSGAWVIDPSNDNQIVAGMSRTDFSGHPYVASGEVAGQYMYFTVPAPTSSLREDVEGYLAKVDLKTWKVVGMAPVGDPCWPEPTQDGKYVWVTECGHSKVSKVDTQTMKVVQELSTGPGPWGARLSYDETKLYVADKGEARGYGQQGRTMTIIDTTANIVSNVVVIGRTTDHVLISPDGGEVWATSNADHAIYVVDAETEEVKQIIKMPADGDTHGGTWARYYADPASGPGLLMGEVVSSMTGLRGTALAVQRDLLKNKPSMITVTAPGTFSPPSLTVKPGESARVTFTSGGGTNSKTIVLESKELGIPVFEIKPGQRKTVEIKAQPAGLGQFASVVDPTKTFKVTFAEPTLPAQPSAGTQTVQPAAGAAAVAGQREITIKTTNNVFDPKTITAKPGEIIKFTLINGDDENHNLVGGEGKMVSPIVGGGQTGTFTWTAPSTTGAFDAICLFHPATKIAFDVKS